MTQKLIILLLFSTSLVFLSVNSYWFIKGFLAVKTVPIETYDVPNYHTEKALSFNKKKLLDTTPVYGKQYAHLIIPKLEAKIPIYYGSKKDQLKYGIGHVEGTAFPGEMNNTVLSGHRDTVFRHLGKIEKGDHLIVETKRGQFTYKVKKIRIVEEDDQTVIVPKPKATLTVITCYPFSFIGSAPQRFVLIAELIAPKELVDQSPKKRP